MKKINSNFLKFLCILMLGLCVTGCSDILNNDDDNDDEESPLSSDITAQSVVDTYATLVYANYQDALTTAQALQVAVEALIAAPSEITLEAAKTAWLAARLPYGQTEGFRFYDGPIDESEGPEGRLNAWPLDEVHIDYVEGESDSGLINDLGFTITKENLIDQNEFGGDKNISTGYHAIEFLLWGQDLTEGAGAGERPYTDYVTTGGGTADNQARRAEYLREVTELLVEDLTILVAAWDPSISDNYREEFVGSPNASLAKLLRGAATLSKSELSSERMLTPLTIGEREEEHSCFSDNTHNDIEMNAKSIQNIYLGRYVKVNGTTVSGTSLYDLTKTVDEPLANRIKAEMEDTMSKVIGIDSPFDQEILPSNAAGNARVESAIDALKTQGDSLVEMGSKFGLTINTDL